MGKWLLSGVLDTHVSSESSLFLAFAGALHGVAKKAIIVPVRVLDCSGSGSYSGLLDALDWVKTDAAGRASVVNLSLGGPQSDILRVCHLADRFDDVVGLNNLNGQKPGELFYLLKRYPTLGKSIAWARGGHCQGICLIHKPRSTEWGTNCFG